MNAMKYFLSITSALCAWLFVVIVIDFNDLLDMPMFVYAAILAIMITGVHMLAAKRYGNPGPGDGNAKMLVKFIVIGFFMLVGTIVAALAVSAAINPESRAELSAPFVTCAREDSRIKTVSVNKQLIVDGGIITVHSITTDVPQSSKNPQPYGYECQKAVLADVSVTSDANGEEKPSIRDLELVTASKPGGITADELNDDSEFAAYASSQKLDALRQSRFDDSRNERGWVAFPMGELDTTGTLRLVFDKYGQNRSVDLN